MVTLPDLVIPVALYGLLVVGLFTALWLYYDRRDRALYDVQRRKITFHCVRCNHLYTERADREMASCPRCHYSNVRLKF